MFERYTEKARRVIFFARYEATQLGHDEIDDPHLLLGLLREDKALAARLVRNTAGEHAFGKIDEIKRRVIEAAGPYRKNVPASQDLPLSNNAKRTLCYAAEEAEALGHRHIGTEHLLLGLMREKKSVAAQIFPEQGVTVDDLRRELSAVVAQPFPRVATAYAGGGYGTGGGRSSVVVEFVCDGSFIASVVLLPGSPVPRAGEQALLNDQAAGAAFRVEEVSYVYDRFPPDIPVAPHVLSKVVVRVRRDQEPEAQNPKPKA